VIYCNSYLERTRHRWEVNLKMNSRVTNIAVDRVIFALLQSLQMQWDSICGLQMSLGSAYPSSVSGDVTGACLCFFIPSDIT
jgi:hypothetical protein